MSAAEFGSWFWSMIYDDVLFTDVQSSTGSLSSLAALSEWNMARNSLEITQFDVLEILET